MNATDVEALRTRLEGLITEAHQSKAKRIAVEEINYYVGVEIALRQVVGLLDELTIPDTAIFTLEQVRKICFKAIGGWECEECRGDYCPFGGGKEAKRDE